MPQRLINGSVTRTWGFMDNKNTSSLSNTGGGSLPPLPHMSPLSPSATLATTTPYFLEHTCLIFGYSASTAVLSSLVFNTCSCNHDGVTWWRSTAIMGIWVCCCRGKHWPSFVRNLSWEPNFLWSLEFVLEIIISAGSIISIMSCFVLWTFHVHSISEWCNDMIRDLPEVFLHGGLCAPTHSCNPVSFAADPSSRTQERCMGRKKTETTRGEVTPFFLFRCWDS